MKGRQSNSVNAISLRGKVAVITGASSGVGRAIAIELAANGVRVVLAARRLKALEEVADECRRFGTHALAVACDVRNREQLQELAATASTLGGKIDVWINNAGVLAAGALEDVPSDVNEDVIRTNLLGYVHGSHAVLPYLKQQGSGIIINNISVGGWFPTPYASAYTASKFGLRGFADALRGELAGFSGIHVCDLYPGFLDTPGMQHAANYTGRVVRPAPPVYDPRRVARAVVKLILRPRPKTTIGASSAFLHLAYAAFPAISRTLTGAFIRSYLRKADPISPTSGNVLGPVDYGTGIDGGWRKDINPAALAGLGLVAVIAASVVAGRRK